MSAHWVSVVSWHQAVCSAQKGEASYKQHLCLAGANPCEHAGKCINTQGSFQCQCLQGYSGPRCEIDVNECLSNPCQNDATCLDQIGEFQCICMPGVWAQLPLSWVRAGKASCAHEHGFGLVAMRGCCA